MSPPNPKLPRSVPHEARPAPHGHPRPRRRREHAHPFSMGPTRPRRRHSPLTHGRRAALSPTTARHSPLTHGRHAHDGACRPRRGCAVACTARPHLLACPAGSWRLARQKTERKGEHSMSGTWCRNEMAETGSSETCERPETGTKTDRGSAGVARPGRGALPKCKKQNLVRYDQRPVGSDFSVITYLQIQIETE